MREDRLQVPLILVATDREHKTQNLVKALSVLGMKIDIPQDGKTFNIVKK